MKLVKTDSKLADLIGRMERNLTDLGKLSQKAFKHLSTLCDVANKHRTDNTTPTILVAA